MDHYGIGTAIEGAARIYCMTARQTGRTVSLVESLKSGDRAVFTNGKEASRVNILCKERGIEVECIVVDPREASRIFAHGSSQGRTIFDHSWIEEYYLNAIQACQRDIDHLERQSSGYGEAHRQTLRAAVELGKWSI